jgi:hypothetical protein
LMRFVDTSRPASTSAAPSSRPRVRAGR